MRPALMNSIVVNLIVVGLAVFVLGCSERHRTELMARMGNAEAQFDLARAYFKSDGVEENNDEAVKWFRQAAEQGHSEAQVSLGVIYDRGKGVGEDDAEAMKWYLMAAEQGHALGQYGLGFVYSYSRDEDIKDDVEAVKWYRKAAEQGLAVAQFQLGLLCGEGQGVAEDDVEAVMWFREAAEQENRDPDTIAIHAIFGPQMADPLAGAEQLAKLGVERVMLPAFFFAGPEGMDNLEAFGEKVVKPHA